MSLVQTLRKALPPFKNDVRLIKQKQTASDIIDEILVKHEECEVDYNRIFQYFDTGSIYETCGDIWNFLKYNLVYNAEKGKEQSVQSPAAILRDGQYIDCKHYSLFAGGVLDAIKRNTGDDWDWCYRFASDKDTENPTHVFVVVFDNNKEIWIDACLTSFNQKKKYIFYIDERPMSLVSISGVNKPAENPGIVIVDKVKAWSNFLTMVQLDMFSLRDLMKNNPEITNGPVKAYCLANGFDFNQLLNFIYAK